MCHLLLLMPFASLIVFWLMPFEQALAIYLTVLTACAVLYWLMWKAFRRPVATGVEGMIGGRGKVIQIGEKKAKIFYRGEIWNASSADPISLGDAVEIAKVERMMLVVRKPAEGQAQRGATFGCH